MSVVWTAPANFFDSAYSSAAAATQGVAAGQVSRWNSALLSRPGVVVELEAPLPDLPGLFAATAAIATTLFEQDTRVWLSPTVDCASVRKYLRGHTGCIVVAEPTLADFAIIARPGELPPFGSFSCGTQADPKSSTTLIVQLDGLEGEGPLRLEGPGIPGAINLAARGLGAAFVLQWNQNARLAPRGIDILLTCGRRLCVLPRTMRIEVQSGPR
jgi:alpha-D-ribose 1-methylphosphonate 5-triphosphate synthase subunit PhnH